MSIKETVENHKAATLGVVGASIAVVGAGISLASNHDKGDTQPVNTNAPIEQEATTTTEVSEPLTTAPSETTIRVEAPAQATTTTEKPVLAKSGENELQPQSVEQVMAQLGHPEVGQKFQENVLFTTLNLKQDTPIYSAPDAASMRLKGEAGGVTNAVLLNGEFACFNMTSDNPDKPELIVACADLKDLGVNLDEIQKGSMTVEKVGQDGRGYGDYNGEEQVIAAFNSTANDVPGTVPPHGDHVTQNPDGSTNWQPPVTPQ